MQTTGSNTGTWGDVLNNQAISYLDENLGGITSLTLSSSNVTLSAAQSRTAILRLTGTLTANVEITTSCIGFFFVENLTSGAFAVTVRNASVATAATITQGYRQTVISDAANGCRALSSGFETGVKQAFYMSTAPLGWTRDATAALNNAAIRLVTTGGATTAGSVDFTTAFASQTPAGTIGGTAITIAQMPAHNHTYGPETYTNEDNNYTPGTNPLREGGGGSSFTSTTVIQSTGGGEAHDHSFTGTAINLAVKYADFLVATRS